MKIKKITKFSLILSLVIIVSCTTKSTGNRFQDNVFASFSDSWNGFNKFEKCDLDPSYSTKITGLTWRYKNNVHSSHFCRNWIIYQCNIQTICKDDSQCRIEAADYYLQNKAAYWTQDRKIKFKKPLDALEKERVNICKIEREICDKSKKNDKTCIKRSTDKYFELGLDEEIKEEWIIKRNP